MANNPMGANFIEGSLGVVRLNFNGVELGKTEGEASLEFIEDLKDILFAQNGTQPYDKVPTGQAYQVTCNLAELTWARLEQLIRGLTSPSIQSAKLGRDIYRSGRDSFAKQLVITRVDSDGVASSLAKFRLTFYKAMPMPTGPVGAFGPDTQRVMAVTFYCMYDETKGAFGFSGSETSLGIS